MRVAYVTETFPPEINGVSLTVDRTLAARALMRAQAVEAAASAQWDHVQARFEGRLEDLVRRYRTPSGNPAVAV